MDFTKPYQFVKEQFCFKGVVLASFNNLPREVMVVLKRTGKTGTCPRCERQRQQIESLYKRGARDLDFRRKCTLIFPRVKIKSNCAHRGIENLDFLDKHSFCTKRLEEHI